MSIAKIKSISGIPTLTVDDEVIAPMAFCSRYYGTDDYAKGLAVDADIRLFFIEVDSGFNDPDSYALMKEQIERILRYRSDALFILRITVNPSQKWLDEHPQECVAFNYEGNIDVYPEQVRAVHGLTGHRIHSPASEQWIIDLKPYLEHFIDRVDSENFSNQVIGYFPCALHGEEWFIPREGIEDLGWDWSKPFRSFFGNWLKRKYQTNERLQKAWRNTQTSFDNPWIVPVSQRKLRDKLESAKIIQAGSREVITADFGGFLDPSKSQAEIDLYHAFMDSIISAIRAVTLIIKNKTDNKKLVGTFYSGFGTQHYTLGGTVAPLSLLQQASELDIIAAPFNYVDRCAGGGASFHRFPIKSVHLHNKLWFSEVEAPTWLTRKELAKYYHGDKYNDKEAVLNVFKRDFASVLSAGVYGWWFNNEPKTYVPGWKFTTNAEWCKDKEIYALFRKQQEISRKYYTGSRDSGAEVAFVYDEKSNWLCDGESVIDLLWFAETFEYPRVGMPIDRIFHADLTRSDIPAYKMLVFLNCFSLTDTERKVIRDYLTKTGAMAVWSWGNGLINLDNPTPLHIKHMEELTGFSFTAEERPRPLDFTVDRNAHKITANIHSQLRFGKFRRPVMSGGLLIGGRHRLGRAVPLDASLGNPVFWVNNDNDKDVTILGRFLFNDKPAFAIKKCKGYYSVYYGAKVINSPILRELAKFAGVHIWTESDDIFYVSKRFFSIHATEECPLIPYHKDEALKPKDAMKKIVLPRKAKVVDCYTEEIITENGDTVYLDMNNGETRSFFIYEEQS